nr:hypothetical protein [uncultured Oscillibacter sp.]
MWKYSKRYLRFAVIAGLFMVGEVTMDLLQPEIMSRIVEQGRHEDLLARKGKYYGLYMTQFAGFST